jgi:nucleoprotein TPR
LTRERDTLLAEKATWTTSGESSSAGGESQQAWEAEKAELIKAKEQAEAQLKVRELISGCHGSQLLQISMAEAKQAANLKLALERAQARLRDTAAKAQADADKHASQQTEAVKAAVEKTKAEMTATPSGDSILVTQHEKDLKELEERLATKHKADLAAAAASAPAVALTTVDQASIDTAVADAIAEKQKEFEKKLEEEVAHATERGRMEQSTKAKLKDQQLVRAQNKMKDLEKQLEAAKAAGFKVEPIAPATAVTTTPAAKVPPTAAPAIAVATTPAAKAPLPAVPATATASASGIPPKPVAAATNPALRTPPMKVPPGAQPGDAAGRGRGGAPVGRGRGLAIRGRGGAPGAPVAPSPTSGGVSIHGAAGKRPREEAAAEDNTLAKRMKAADATTGTTPSKGPIKIQRPTGPPPS